MTLPPTDAYGDPNPPATSSETSLADGLVLMVLFGALYLAYKGVTRRIR